MKKYFEWGMSHNSILFDTEEDQLYNMQNTKDRETLAEYFSAEIYYESRSGFRGKGYIEDIGRFIMIRGFETGVDNKIIPLRNYKEEYEFITIKEGVEEINGTYLYLETDEENINEDARFCAVVVCKNCSFLFFGNKFNIKDVLWKVNKCYEGDSFFSVYGHNLKEIEIPYIKKYDHLDIRGQHKYRLYVDNHNIGMGLNYLRFIPKGLLPMDNIATGHIPILNYETNVYEEDGQYFKVNPVEKGYAFLEKKYEKNPFENPELLNGWRVIKDGKYKIIGKEKGERIYLIGFTHLKAGGIDKWIEYEWILDILKFVSARKMTLDRMIEGLKNKIKYEIKLKRENKKIDEVIAALPDDTMITIEDSINAGNCMPGTKRFIKDNFPGKEKVEAKKLKEFNNFAVQKVLLIKAEEIVPEKVREIRGQNKIDTKEEDKENGPKKTISELVGDIFD
ncbi:MAG: hypothetical protein ACOCT9_01315 [archaeon]